MTSKGIDKNTHNYIYTEKNAKWYTMLWFTGLDCVQLRMLQVVLNEKLIFPQLGHVQSSSLRPPITRRRVWKKKIGNEIRLINLLSLICFVIMLLKTSLNA